jgi:hypothetical protein
VTLVNVDPLGSRHSTLLTAEEDVYSTTPPTAEPASSLVHYDHDSPLPPLFSSGMACVEEMERQGNPIAKKVMKLVKEAIQRHEILQISLLGAAQGQGQSTTYSLPNNDDDAMQSEGVSVQQSHDEAREQGQHTTMFDQLVEACVGHHAHAPDQSITDADLTSILEDYLRGFGTPLPLG